MVSAESGAHSGPDQLANGAVPNHFANAPVVRMQHLARRSHHFHIGILRPRN